MRKNRAELVAEYRVLLAQGHSSYEIAEMYGKSYNSIRNLLADPEGEKQRARRKRYEGKCQVCGAATTGCNGKESAPRFCQKHIGANEKWRLALTKWPRELLIARIREWNALYGRPPAVPDWSPNLARHLNDEDRARRFENANGYWPWFTLIVRRFGSWNAGIEAAGFIPRKPGGSGGTRRRKKETRR